MTQKEKEELKNKYEDMIKKYYNEDLGINNEELNKLNAFHASIEETESEKLYVVRCPECKTLQYTSDKESKIKCQNELCDVEFLAEYEIQREEAI
ncbi:MAG: hypothetical protein ACOCUI_01480 [bacterium]